MSLYGKVAVITGASSGIGKATALRFAERGANLILAARRIDALAETADACRQRGVEALPLETDVTSSDDVERLRETAVKRFGKIDVWVNDAGVYLLSPFEDTPLDVFRRVIETNYFGVVYGSMEAVRVFKQQGGGVLINVGSVDSKIGMPYVSAYVSSKFAVRGLDECLDQELMDTGVRVCTVMPSAMDTPIFQHAGNYVGKRAKAPNPVYDPDKVARTIVRCAEHPRREVIVGGGGKAWAIFRALAPLVFQRTTKHEMEADEFLDEPVQKGPGNILEPMSAGTDIRGGWLKRQPISRFMGLIPALVAVPAGAAAWFWVRPRVSRLMRR